MDYLAITIPWGESGQKNINPPSGVIMGQNAIPNAINSILTLMIALGTALVVIFIIYAGITFATSGGDKQKVEAARGTLTYAIVGLLVIILCFAILSILSNITGLNFNLI